ncbi:DeoR/GlpR family DNA-binding transcription regulator [Enterococcus dongliensis]|uniref:DeoR/GlpR family DNA-binding transcription regulator n=1 Tax=Enterococcus dongliensis TaxID=2559925 RepID=UPI00288CEC37|nr:DeoR/GlpR family DNA-binding transcription regulator [Enterococcus dongliensis]MDT2640950.1 DeoR/GlpR family DNA-binding transcription regulator [Enterococcus dongliensis]MDT2668506.1 DeoR/GlpR family DNA-binding transcription regulator [Enterococcus dongliensis]MDT2676656.1 DeoR/GlpR family DNA-binding transcription regulator [Enterococcus dongliensis]MDT2703694.1 DeoR/GlpR family DNA-binding transcription regulator [Enterococcus dongliensis]
MKNSLANIDKRQKDILDLLQQTEQMTTFELADSLNVSISTIRRDLSILEEKNDIIRNYGYCSYNYENKTNFDQSGPERIKQAIAREASKYINDYDTLFINSSSTALKTLDYITSNHLTIVTNNVKVNYSPHKDNCSYILTGGEMRFPKEALVGDITLNTISSMNADICIIGCSGVSIKNGVTTKILNESTVNEMMINKTIKCKILVADHRKINLTSKFKIADISVFDYLITDQFSSQKVVNDIRNTGVKVIQID